MNDTLSHILIVALTLAGLACVFVATVPHSTRRGRPRHAALGLLVLCVAGICLTGYLNHRYDHHRQDLARIRPVLALAAAAEQSAHARTGHYLQAVLLPGSSAKLASALDRRPIVQVVVDLSRTDANSALLMVYTADGTGEQMLLPGTHVSGAPTP